MMVVIIGMTSNMTVTNTGSKQSSKRSVRSGKFSIFSVKIKADPGRAALVAPAAALKERHTREEQEVQKSKEEKGSLTWTKLAASAAKLAEL